MTVLLVGSFCYILPMPPSVRVPACLQVQNFLTHMGMIQFHGLGFNLPCNLLNQGGVQCDPLMRTPLFMHQVWTWVPHLCCPTLMSL